MSTRREGLLKPPLPVVLCLSHPGYAGPLHPPGSSPPRCPRTPSSHPRDLSLGIAHPPSPLPPAETPRRRAPWRQQGDRTTQSVEEERHEKDAAPILSACPRHHRSRRSGPRERPNPSHHLSSLLPLLHHPLSPQKNRALYSFPSFFQDHKDSSPHAQAPPLLDPSLISS